MNICENAPERVDFDQCEGFLMGFQSLFPHEAEKDDFVYTLKSLREVYEKTNNRKREVRLLQSLKMYREALQLSQDLKMNGEVLNTLVSLMEEEKDRVEVDKFIARYCRCLLKIPDVNGRRLQIEKVLDKLSVFGEENKVVSKHIAFSLLLKTLQHIEFAKLNEKTQFTIRGVMKRICERLYQQKPKISKDIQENPTNRPYWIRWMETTFFSYDALWRDILSLDQEALNTYQNFYEFIRVAWLSFR